MFVQLPTLRALMIWLDKN